MDTYEDVLDTRAGASERAQMLSLGEKVRQMPIEYLPGVRETLSVLRERRRLILFTKGDYSEQSDKVERSGARAFFHEVEVTAEKREGDYHRLIEQHAIVRESSWMVGNSVRSDINPALKAGLGAVFIPHPQTWSLEHEEVEAAPDARLEILERFSELLRLFDKKAPGED